MGWLEFLRTEHINGNGFFIDNWTFVHIAAGALLATIFKKPLHGVVAIILFEVFEHFLMVYNLIRPELLIDTFWDLVFTIGGYLIMHYLVLNRS